MTTHYIIHISRKSARCSIIKRTPAKYRKVERSSLRKEHTSQKAVHYMSSRACKEREKACTRIAHSFGHGIPTGAAPARGKKCPATTVARHTDRSAKLRAL